jgi:polysaccharide export outer membrane protein
VLPSPGVDVAYQIGRGDRLRIEVYDAPDPAIVVQVTEEGSIIHPFVGPVAAAGLTAGALATVLEQRLSAAGIYLDPQVAITILEVQASTMTISGLVGRPGRYTLDRQSSTLSELIAEAGGITPQGGSRLTIVRNTPDGPLRLNADLDRVLLGLEPDLVLQPGDRILVPQAQVFYIRGAVQRAGQYPVEAGMTVGQALALGGGLNDRGSSRRVRIFRVVHGERRALRAPTGAPVQPGDELVVGERLF